MPRPSTPKQLRRAKLGLLVIATVLLAPIAVYVWTFGLSIVGNHTRWSEMGSAMAGIYSPILSILTLVLLFAQVNLQVRMNEHTFDHGFVQDARADLHFYLDQLASELSREFDDGSEIRTRLIEVFAYSAVEDLADPKVMATAAALNIRYHRLVAVWSAVYAILAGLKANGYAPYSNNYSTAQQKAIAVLSYECCAALDNLTWCACEGRIKFAYLFSAALRETSQPSE